MPEPLINLLRLRTTPPAVPPGFLERPRLDEKLTAATSRALTLLCAGPGHGKTLTLASWVRHRSRGNVAWLALDDTDNDPQAFWFDLLGALAVSGAVPIDSPLRDLVPAARFNTEATMLISTGVAALAEPVVLVLDDFHLITDGQVLRSIERVLDRVRKVAESGFARGVSILENFDPSLPPVLGDRDQLIQVFLNLVRNAADALPEKGGEITLTTGYRPGVKFGAGTAGERVSLPLEVTVRDNGSGVPTDLLPYIFDPFVTTKVRGSGLGLALVAKIVGDHGGVIECDSVSGRTIFRVLLPQARGGES